MSVHLKYLLNVISILHVHTYTLTQIHILTSAQISHDVLRSPVGAVLPENNGLPTETLSI